MNNQIKNKVLLITGGTGSFGTAVLNRFLNTDHFKEIRIFSRDEKKQDDMRNHYKNEKIKFYIGDVRDFISIESAMIGVDYVFHAAALKQVPSCEFFPMQAVKTNVEGTHNVLRAAIQNKVEKVICLSTDKAAYPINAMGMSKAMMEKVAIAESRNTTKTTICLTRYGNVMASRGSVIPLFLSQIEKDYSLNIPAKIFEQYNNYEAELKCSQKYQYLRRSTMSAMLLAMKLTCKKHPSYDTNVLKAFGKKATFDEKCRRFRGIIIRIIKKNHI